MSEKSDITHLFTFDNKTEIKDYSHYFVEKCTTTAVCKKRIELQSFIIKTEGYYYRDYVGFDGHTVIERRGDASMLEVQLVFDDETKQVCSRFYVNGTSGIPLIETHEIVFNIPEEKNIKKVLLLYNSRQSEHSPSSSIERWLKIISIKAYGRIAGFDTGIRIKGTNGRIYKILGIYEQSSLRVKTPTSIKNIKATPLAESQNSQLRIMTKQGIMAVAIEE